MKRISLFEDPGSCSGCGACLTVCPREAITMMPGTLGSLYPRIEEEKCIHCGKCLRVCSFRESVSGNRPRNVYAALGRRDELVKNSASGGVFASVADECLAAGVPVAGAVMTWEDGQADVYHVLASSAQELPQIQGSKYVQSRAWDCYGSVLRALASGKTVLFSGTPCQVAAVRKLTGDPENLVTMDLICHGVPSLQSLNESAAILAGRLGGKVEQLIFRDKSRGKQFWARVHTRRGKHSRQWYLRARSFPFYQMFLEGSIYRESCYRCPYAATERISDITIGDYWGVRQFHGEQIRRGEMPDRQDWSCVLVNTEKGQTFLARYGTSLQLYESHMEWVAANNGQLNRPSPLPEDRQEILDCCSRGNWKAVEGRFIRKNGGWLRFCWRMYKSLYQNRKTEVNR